MPSKKVKINKVEAAKTPKALAEKRAADQGETSGPSLLAGIPIVGIGASAGGLEALERLFSRVPNDAAVAFVVITHLNLTYSSLLPELLQKSTRLKVQQIAHDIKASAGCVYVTPPNKNVVIAQGTLKLIEPKSNGENVLPINVFFQSLAEEQDRKIIAVILSGTGMDGSQGAQAINAAGGLVIAQDPATAKYEGMPNSIIATGLVDYIASPEGIPERIFKHLQYTFKILPNESQTLQELQPIYHLLRSYIGHDFSLYKHNTICRRIEKRMNVHQINSVALYARYLQYNPSEIQLLFKDLLIGVTNFFRNPEAFENLRQNILLNLKSKPKDQELRVWVPACATGEEAYSLAILLQECMEETKCHFNVQIFGTDIDETAIETARIGLYQKNIISNMSEERLKRFFVKEEGLYRISKDIRKMVVFAIQNVIKDPPFTKLDLLSCRNLLIYLTVELQKKLLPMFHYSLNYNGILLLGSAENIGNFMDLFNVLDKKWKIFSRKEGAFPLQSTLEFEDTMSSNKLLAYPPPAPKKTSKKESDITNIARLIENILLENYAPVCIVLDEKDNIVYVHGHTGRYLELETGVVNLNILQMARCGLKLKLENALRQVTLQKKHISYNNIQIKDQDKVNYVNLQIRPFRELKTGQFWKLVIIEDINLPKAMSLNASKNDSNDKLAQRIVALEQELKHSEENLQTSIEELETSNEELKSSNEELQSTNEELQSTNEELETSKEELQSLNEELTTVNAELEARIEELSSANDDIQNLLHSTEIAAIFLDNQLCVKRFTPKATELTNLIQTDVGRPIADIVSKLKYDTLIEDAHKVLETLSFKSVEVQNKEGEWFQVRIMPYRTLTNMIDGVVITFLNINMQKQAEERAKQLSESIKDASACIPLIIDILHEPALILNEKTQIVGANASFYKTFQVKLEDVLNRSLSELWRDQVDLTLLQKLFEKELHAKDRCHNFELSYQKGKEHPQKLMLNAQRINRKGLADNQLLLTIECK